MSLSWSFHKDLIPVIPTAAGAITRLLAHNERSTSAHFKVGEENSQPPTSSASTQASDTFNIDAFYAEDNKLQDRRVTFPHFIDLHKCRTR